MAVIATLVLGSNLATSKGGKSAPLSTPADRKRFLDLHRSAGAFIIGKNSAAIESYQQSQVPIFVFTRDFTPLNFTHPMMQQINVDRNLGEITRLIDFRIPGDVVVEAGASLLTALIGEKVIDELQLSITPIEGDGDFISLNVLLKGFEVIEEVNVDGTRLLQCRN